MLNGTRAGILDGERAPVLMLEVVLAGGFRRIMLVGVLVPEREGGGPRRTLPPRWLGGAIDLVLLLNDDAGAMDGVFDRGGGAARLDVSAISSRYLSPRTQNGRPYSSSQSSRTFLRSTSILGSSFVILFLIFSSLNSRVGSRLSPFCPRTISLDAS